jgi:tRNA 2-thiouridine synthesizing protein C
MRAMTKKILLILRKPPYGNSLAREALDIALATSVFEQELAILFLNDGIWQLLEDQNSESISSKNIGKTLAAFPLYDIDQIFVSHSDLVIRALDKEKFIIPVEVLSDEKIPDFIDSFDVVMNF